MQDQIFWSDGERGVLAETHSLYNIRGRGDRCAIVQRCSHLFILFSPFNFTFLSLKYPDPSNVKNHGSVQVSRFQLWT